MRTENINFGARLTQNTFDFLVKARTNGLRTEKMENLMKEVYPDEFISTDMRNGQIVGMGIIENPRVTRIGNGKKILSGDGIIGESYSINQNTINTITEKLEAIKNRQKLFPEKMIKWELVRKFGAPVPDNANRLNEEDYLV